MITFRTAAATLTRHYIAVSYGAIAAVLGVR